MSRKFLEKSKIALYNVAEAEMSADLWEMSQMTDRENSYQNFPDIDSFLDDYRPLSEYIAEDEQTLQFQIPRRTGSTLLTHLVAHERSAIVIMPGHRQKKDFECQHNEFFPGDHLLILSCNSIKHIRLSDIQLLMELSQAAEQTHAIIMDVFRAYADNSGVKKLWKDFRLTHKFIMFR